MDIKTLCKLYQSEKNIKYLFFWGHKTKNSDFVTKSIISSNDEIVSPQSSYALANSLQTEIINIENAGHFLDRDGFTRLLPVYDVLKTIVSG
ncbi:alpha/beta hydrolase [Xenorhabdus sp. SGI246]|uniref:alpha/beta hydrolase n=1 Tax=Xenorhabdus sp. SGI246 TaxID=3158263 RepID=UPI00349F64DF